MILNSPANDGLPETVVCVLHLIMNGMVCDKRDQRRGGTPLHSLRLRRLLQRRTERTLAEVQTLRLAERDKHYLVGKQSCRWKLGPNCRGPWGARPVTDSRLELALVKDATNRRTAERESAKALNRLDIFNFLVPRLHQLKIDDFDLEHVVEQHLQDLIDDQHELNLRQYVETIRISIDRLRRSDIFKSFDEYGRFHSNLTCLWSRARAFLHVNWVRLVGIDIKNSQPLFLARLLRSEQHNQVQRGTPERASSLFCAQSTRKTEFQRAVEGGRLYETLGEKIGRNWSRSRAKTATMQLLYGPNHYAGPLVRAFEDLFPDVLGYIRHIKREDYRRLAHLLQRAESDFVFDGIVDRVRREQPNMWIGTVHDSICTTAGNENYLREAMLEEAEAIGLAPALTTEAYAP